jgi:UPF0271 protein
MEIDLNSDIGEGFGDYTLGDDQALLGIISSSNIACGFHAGDPVIMHKTIRLAMDHHVDLGAHVGFPDLMGFGRRQMQCDPGDLSCYILYQLGALAGMAAAAGTKVTHMSFHGALGNMAAADYALAEPMVQAVASFDSDIIISVSTNTQIERAARKAGLKVATTFLADRAYTDEGDLVSRKLPGAVIKDQTQVLERVKRLLDDGVITSINGKKLPIKVQSILLHGDTPGAVDNALAIRQEIERGNGSIVPISRMTNLT